MASGCVLQYRGKRGTTWSLKYEDASGKQVRERLGKASEGWTRTKAKQVLRDRLHKVDQGYKRPDPVRFATFARKWADEYPEAEGLRRTTTADYRAMVENHLIPFFGSKKLAEITTSDVSEYVVKKRAAGFEPRTINVHLTRLNSIFDAARREGLVTRSPVADAKRPKVSKKPHWTILTPVEIAAVMKAFDELIAEAETDTERAWRQTAKTMTVAMQFAWLRRGELLGLHWRDLELGHPDGPRLHVRETLVRGHRSDPKTDDGVRDIDLDKSLAEELWQHWRRSAYREPDDLVFCHPHRGTSIPSGYFAAIIGKVLARAGITRPMREYHDWRHTGITNAAGAGMNPLAIMRMAGHADFKTTQTYLQLAKVSFAREVSKLGDWYGTSDASTKNQYEIAAQDAETRMDSGVASLDD